MKKKLLVVILFCLSITGFALTAQAREVINVDLNVEGDANAYNGQAAYDTNNALYDDGTTWRVVYPNMTIAPTTIPGMGIPVGSPRSSNLSDANEPNSSITLAAQIWIDNNSVNSIGYRNTSYPSPGLMNDGFRKNDTASDPVLKLWGVDGYKGTFDIYVYGSEAGSFTLTQWDNKVTGVEPNDGFTVVIPIDSNSWRVTRSGTPGWVSETKTVTGGFGVSTTPGTNFVIFPNVSIDTWQQSYLVNGGTGDGNTVTVSDSNTRQTYLSYSNVINGLQLVSLKNPVAILKTGTVIPAGLYDVAGERSGTTTREDAVSFGPSLSRREDHNLPYPQVGQIERREFMTYDVTVDSANKGRYAITLDVDPQTYGTVFATIFVDDVNMGSQIRLGEAGPGPTSTPIFANLTEGNHTIKWMNTCKAGSSTGYAIFDVNIALATDANLTFPNCGSIAKANLTYESDLNKDCRVDRKDLAIFVDSWLECDDPNWVNCK